MLGLFSPRKTVGTLYIRLQHMYTYIGTYTYIYIHTRRVSIRFVLYACHSNHAGSSPHGVPFTFIFSCFFKIPKTKLKSFRISRPSRNMLQNDGAFTRTEKGSPLFFQLAHWGERSWSSCRSIPHFEIQPKNLAHCQPANWPFHRAQVKKEFIL